MLPTNFGQQVSSATSSSLASQDERNPLSPSSVLNRVDSSLGHSIQLLSESSIPHLRQSELGLLENVSLCSGQTNHRERKVTLSAVFPDIASVGKKRRSEIPGEGQKNLSNRLDSLPLVSCTDIKTPLYEACEQGNKKGVEAHLSQLDINAILRDGGGPLHVTATMAGNDESSVYIDIFRLLLKHGANIHLVDTHGCTALHKTCVQGNAGLTQVLIDAGADVNHVPKNDMAAADLVAWQGHVETARVLVAAGANVHRVNAKGKTAIDYAEQRKHSAVADVFKKASGFPSNKSLIYQVCCSIRSSLSSSIVDSRSENVTREQLIQKIEQLKIPKLLKNYLNPIFQER